MRLTEARQGVRMLKFMDVFGRWEAAELNQLDASELLGVGERTFRRWCRRYEEVGETGLRDRRIGKASGRRVPVDRSGPRIAATAHVAEGRTSPFSRAIRPPDRKDAARPRRPSQADRGLSSARV